MKIVYNLPMFILTVLLTSLVAHANVDKGRLEEFNRTEEQAAENVERPDEQPATRALPKQKVEASEESRVESRVESQPVLQSAGYLTKLSNAYGCFKEFLSAVLQKRFERDDHYMACANSGSASCGASVQQENSASVQSLGDRFSLCLNKSPE